MPDDLKALRGKTVHSFRFEGDLGNRGKREQELMERNSCKIFGIGLSKTGTTSLARALEILGYRTKDYLGVVRYAAGDLSSIDLRMIDENDAFTDTPIPSFYRELDTRYPGSKFILTVREREGWLLSCKKQFTQRLAEKQNDAHKRLFMDLYGTDVFDEHKFHAGYERFVTGVLDYFKNRSNNLLVMDVTAGDGWDKLCAFLKKPVPDTPFPKANVTQIRWIDIGELVAIARDAGAATSTLYRLARAPHDREGNHPPEDTPAAELKRIAKTILWKAIHIMPGGPEAVLRRTRQRAHKVIIRRLKSLTPQIPVLSPLSNNVSHPERAKWNHFWLVNSLSEPSKPRNTNVIYTVNIALVEDGQPIYGVVYAPAMDTTYYAKAGQGSFKIKNDAQSQKLGPRDDPALEPARLTQETLIPPDGRDDVENDHILKSPLVSYNHALAMCLVAEGQAKAYRCTEPTMEWDIAAAHAILGCVGKTVYDCGSRRELKYNKKDLINGCFAVD